MDQSSFSVMRIIRTTCINTNDRNSTSCESTSSNIGRMICFPSSRLVSVHRNHMSGLASSDQGIHEDSGTPGSKDFSWIVNSSPMKSRKIIPSRFPTYTIIPHGRKQIRTISPSLNHSIPSHDVPISRGIGMSSRDNTSENGNHLSTYANHSKSRTLGRKSYVSIMDSRIRRLSYGLQGIHPLTSSMYIVKSDPHDGYITRSSIRSSIKRRGMSGPEYDIFSRIPPSRPSRQRRENPFLKLQK